MPTLHVVNKPPEHPRFAGCLAAVGEQDTLLLVENGVMALACSRTCRALPPRTHVLLPDVEARGLGPEALAAAAELIDYTGFVRLTTANPKIINW